MKKYNTLEIATDFLVTVPQDYSNPACRLLIDGKFKKEFKSIQDKVRLATNDTIVSSKHIPTESIDIDGKWHDVESANYNNIHPNGTCQYCHIENKESA